MNFCKIFKRTTAFAVSVVVIMSFAFADELDELASVRSLSELTAGETNSDWYAYAVGKIGLTEGTEDYLKRLTDYVTEKYAENGVLDKNKITEWHRIALTVNALGGDPSNVGGINLIKDGITEPIISIDRQGINGLIWAAITAQECGVEFNGELTLEEICRKIVEKQNFDGGFSLRGDSDPDITSMAIVALWNVKNFRPYAELAHAALVKMRLPEGGFASYGVENCESAAWAVKAFACVGDEENEKKALEQVKRYKTEGGYSHTLGGKADNMSLWQAMTAFIVCEKSKKTDEESKKINAELAQAGTAAEVMSTAQATEQAEEPLKDEETKPEIQAETENVEEAVEKTEEPESENPDKTKEDTEEKDVNSETENSNNEGTVTAVSVVAVIALAAGTFYLIKRKNK